ncbi:hypothetical protein ACILDT_09495 [Capnocytophaga canis]|uniref:hypothetical protein n=1 Tax=Capnocytophaga canis TaxID=1848903 RepID=UPI0037D8FD96
MKVLYTLLIGLLIVGCNNAGQQQVEQKEQKREKQGGGFFAPVEDKLLGTFSSDPSGKKDLYSIVKEGNKYLFLEEGKKDVEFIPVKVEELEEEVKEYLKLVFEEEDLNSVIEAMLREPNEVIFIKTKKKVKIFGEKANTEYLFLLALGVPPYEIHKT